ncbi:sensor histidine kinase [Paenibacillus psychroresistens]|nr:sensor histidine kinase [Paenibacillus psychroresistens]
MSKKVLNLLKSAGKYFTRRTLKFDFIMVFTFSVFIPALVINLYYFNKIDKYVQDKVQFYNEEIIRELGSKLDFLLTQVDIMEKQMISTIIYTQVFVNYSAKSPVDRVSSVDKTEAVLKNIRMGFSLIFDVYLMGNDGNAYSSNSSFNKNTLIGQEYLTKLNESDESQDVVPTHLADYGIIHQTNPKYVISFLKKTILDVDNSSSGVVQVDLKYEELKRIIETANQLEVPFLIVTDGKDRVLYAQDDSMLGQDFAKVPYKQMHAADFFGVEKEHYSKDFIALKHTLQVQDWNVYTIIPKEGIFHQIATVKNVSVFVLVISLLFSFFAFNLLSRNIIRPITILVRTMRKVGDGQLNLTVPSVRNRDLQILSSSFNSMVNKIDILMNNVIQKEKEKTRSDLLALQAQINPHFLYNTLNTIKWMALMEKSEPIANAIVSLVNVLEFSSKDSERIILIAEELQFIESYIAILKLRYGQSVQIEIQVSAEIHQFYTLKFILQPIIENAVMHGLGKKNYKGLIVVKGKLVDNDVYFEIEDDGVGMIESNTDKLTGLGIRNVDLRLQLHFGESYALQIFSIPNEGTRVIIKIPMISEEAKIGYV